MNEDQRPASNKSKNKTATNENSCKLENSLNQKNDFKLLLIVTVDIVSYQANVVKLLSTIRDCGDEDSIKVLWEITFQGRRAKIMEGKLGTIDEILRNACPVLNQTSFVSHV